MKGNITERFDDVLYADSFDYRTMIQGKDCYKHGDVKKIRISNDGNHITSQVSGRSGEIYVTEIDIEDDGFFDVDGGCTCEDSYNCKHVYATLLKAKERDSLSLVPSEQSETQTVSHKSTAVSDWLSSLTPTQKASSANARSSNDKEHHILYIIQPERYQRNKYTIEIEVKLSRCLVRGGYGKPQKFSMTAESNNKHMKPEDNDILARLQFCNRTSHGYHFAMKISGPSSDQLLMDILRTGRCYWQNISENPTRLAESKAVSFKWNLLDGGSQKLELLINERAVHFFALNRFWYFDSKSNSIGEVESDLAKNILIKLLQAPEVPVEEVDIIRSQLEKLAPGNKELLPSAIKPIKKIIKEPTPVLTVDIHEFQHSDNPFFAPKTFELPTAEISFDYDGLEVPFSKANKSETVRTIENGNMYEFKRNFSVEKDYLMNLQDLIRLEQLDETESKHKATKLIISSIQDETDLLHFVMKDLPAIEKAGWKIVRNHEAFVEVIFEEDLSWYSELEEESSYDYFEYNLGIIVENEKVDILPVVAQLARSTKPEEIDEIPDTETIPLPLPDGKLLAVPFSRIKPILNILVELYDSDVSETDSFKLSKRQASLLYEIEKAFNVTQMRWFGGSKLRKLGEKLANFKSIKQVKPPKTFKATLRKYQQEGVNWLQFLREYEMNGILADDMGLGKTVQTLAHLCIEKNRKRMRKPSLIIAPTSLMVNWQNEAKKFAPSLKIMVYHGGDRHQYDEQFHNFDLIFTTYPLLFRDKDVLLAHEFYYLILDEAQYIKNHKAKSTQIVHQIKAEKRLCLTGTPMENHLTELWSLFNFLMPGVLGNALQFKQLFRNPIEKNDDKGRQAALAKRIKPFLLRRKKDQVLDDLPEKTIIVRNVELSGSQRDLYESIRLSMEQKVRQALQEKGLSRSHIIILDAILKLRQICCHPNLLALDAAKKACHTSAKTNLLMEMLPNMIEEGRRIILFSQFTKMLEIIEGKLAEAGIQYAKLTGATVNRKRAIDSFQEGNVQVFLISLKAGGTGLNLTAADTVIHYDPWWNPSVEDQATDRAHRIGQKNPVFVYKLLSSGTIEETIHEMQQKKRKIIEGLLSENASGKLSLTADDLNHLFRPM